ncbi:MAG: AAA family ATPase [Nitrososphaeria archaeon]
MQVTKLMLENFLSFKEKTEFELGELTILIGPNGSGKTNVMRALKFLGDHLDMDISTRSATPDLYYFNDTLKPLRISAEIKVNDKERKLIEDFLRLLFANDILNLMRTYYSEDQSSIRDLASILVAPGGPLDDIMLELSGVTLECESSVLKQAECNFIFRLKLKSLNKELCYEWKGLCAGLLYDCDEYQCIPPTVTGKIKITSIIMQGLENLGIITPYKWDKEKYIVSVFRDKFDFINMQLKLTDLLNEKLKSEKGILITFNNDLNISFLEEEARRSNFIFLNNISKEFLNGLKEIGYSLEGNINVNLVSLLGKIIAHSMIKLEQLRGPIPETINAGEFNKALMIQRSLNTEKTVRIIASLEHFSGNILDHEVLAKIQDQISKITGFKPYTYLEWSDNSQLIKVKFEENKKMFHPELVPAGVIELLNIMTSIIVASEKILLLDEPGQNLHPTKQVELLRAIEELARNERTQVVIATHSPYMLDPELIAKRDGKIIVYRLTKKNGTSFKNAPFNDLNAKEHMEVITRLQKNPSFRAALFSHAAVVTEGHGELVFLEILQSRGLLSEYEPLAIVFSDSDKSVEKYLKWLNGFGVPALAFCDSLCLKDLHEDVKQQVVAIKENDLGLYILKKFENECNSVKAHNKPIEKTCKDPDMIYKVMMKADDKTLKDIVNELELNKYLDKIVKT